MDIAVSPARTTTQLLAEALLARLRGATRGHCARVDYLTSAGAVAVCRELRAAADVPPDLAAYVLTAGAARHDADQPFITTDRAIERRNRKDALLCLFVPAGLVDAAFSSLSNSFEMIDGRQLQHDALALLVRDLPTDAAKTLRSVFAQVRLSPRASDEQRLDLAAAVRQHAMDGTLAGSGRELWRVGLIPDAGEGFADRLDRNRRCVLSLIHPPKLQATVGERVQSLHVDTRAAQALTGFFRHRSVNDARSWTRALLDEPGLTFDCWRFPLDDPSDLKQVTVANFINEKGEVEKYCRLRQPDGPGGALMAYCGPKESLVVRWHTDPPAVNNLASWHVEVVPATDDVDGTADVDLPARVVPARRSEATLKLDLDLDESLDYALRVRVLPLDKAGNQLVNAETGEPIQAESDDFYLMPQGATLPPPPPGTRTTVPTLAFGRLHILVEKGEAELVEGQPQWHSKDLDYFSVRLNDRHVVTIGLSPLLRRLEERVIADPTTGGRLRLALAEVRPADADLVQSDPIPAYSGEAWQAFAKAREAFFARLRKAQPRDLIETAEWTAELAGAALRHAQAYRQMLEHLLAQHADDELRDALSVDTVLVQTGAGSHVEEALILLPTHPLRAAWFASYTQLLHEWERRPAELPTTVRRTGIDLDMLRHLAPANTPAFAYHPACSRAFIFTQNLHVAAAVALPPAVADPHRRYADLATIAGVTVEQADDANLQPDRLAGRLGTFQELHPYADPLVITLLNPDRGDVFADALTILSRQPEAQHEDDPDAPRPPATFDVTAYVEDLAHTGQYALDRFHRLQAERQSAPRGDHFLPSLAVTLRDAETATAATLDDAHVAIVTDYTRPSVAVVPPAEVPAMIAGSFSLYGLITRFVPAFTATDAALLWRYHIVTDTSGRPDVHPAGPRYSETLHELHATLLDAVGRALTPTHAGRPALDIRLDADRRRLLDALHHRASWVVTLDRFFALDYYDSPRLPGLDDVARTYVLDYSPEFTEGLDHRLMVTTAWHDEIHSALVHAMEDLGFATVDHSVRQLLHYLKTISGHLALQVLSSTTTASAAAGLGVVTAWLQACGRFEQAVLLPVDAHPHLFAPAGSAAPSHGERRCDLVLIGLRRNIVDATFIEVKWRRGTTSFEALARDMLLQMSGTVRAFEQRCFDDTRPDGALQRAYLANILRFYFERSKRYGLFDPGSEATFLEHLTRLEKAGLDFRANLEGYIVSLDGEPHAPWLEADGDRSAKITLLTARDFEDATPFQSGSARSVQLGAPPAIDAEAVPVAGTETSPADNGPDDLTAAVTGSGDSDDAGAPTLPESLPADGSIASKGTDPIVVALGETAGVEVDWRPSTTGSPHLFIAGIPGQGKSWSVTRLLTSLGEQGLPALVFDFHGQFADPASPYVRRVTPTVLDAARGLPFSPFELPAEDGSVGWRANAYELAEIFGYVADLGDIQQDAIYQAIRDAYQAHGYGTGPSTPDSAPTLEEVLGRLEALEQTRRVSNITARCRPLLEMDLFRPGPDYPDLLTQVKGGMVIDLHSLTIEAVQLAAGAFVLRKIYKDMFRWGASNELRLAIVLDEAHRLARDVTLPKLMKEGRKFGIMVIVASQGLADFHPDIVANAGTKIIFRTNYPDSRRIAGFIRARQGVALDARIEQLPVGSAYVQTPEMAFGAQVRMYPLA